MIWNIERKCTISTLNKIQNIFYFKYFNKLNPFILCLIHNHNKYTVILWEQFIILITVIISVGGRYCSIFTNNVEVTTKALQSSMLW